MDTIAKQKALADRVYALLCKDYDVLLAGGAPRDWHIGEKARDLDFFIYSETPEKDAKILSERLGINLVNLGDKYDEMMGEEPALLGVFEGEMHKQIVQLIFVAIPPIEFVKEKFDISVCKVWYTGGEIKMDWEARLSFRENVLVMKDGFNPHAEKLVDRDPWGGEFAFLGSWERVLNFIEKRRYPPRFINDEDEWVVDPAVDF